MGLVRRTKVGLRIFGDDLDPDHVSAVLRVDPSGAEAKGTTLTTPRGITRITRTGGWRPHSPLAETEQVDSHVCWLFSATTQDLAVWLDLSNRYSTDLFVGLFMEDGNEGFALSPATLASIAERGLRLDFDIYYNGEQP